MIPYQEVCFHIELSYRIYYTISQLLDHEHIPSM